MTSDKPGAVIYCRVSTEDQAENGTSLETQERAGYDFAERELRLPVLTVYRDEGISGAKFDRPGLQAALCDIREGRACALVSYDISRLSRDSEHQQRIKKIVRNAGATLKFCKGSFDDTEEGDLAFGIMGQMADYERRLFRRRSMSGKRQRAEEGLQPCRTHSPFGYHIVTKEDVMSGRYPIGTEGTYQVLSETAPWGSRIFEEFAEHGCISRIVRLLLDSRVPTVRGGEWRPATVRQILLNPVYKGKATFGRRMVVPQDSHEARPNRPGTKRDYSLRETPPDRWTLIDAPALVEEPTWDRCQEILRSSATEKKARHGGTPLKMYMLASLTRCVKCGNRTYAKVTGGIARYICRDPYCDKKTPGYYLNNRMDRVEGLTVQALLYLVQYPDVVPETIRAYHDEKRGRHEGRDTDTMAVASLQAGLERVNARERKVADAQVDAMLKGRDTAVYERMLNQINGERRELASRLADLAPPPPPPVTAQEPEDTTAILRRVSGQLEKVLTAGPEDFTPAEKQKLLALVIDRITPNDEGVEIELKTKTLYKVNLTFQGTATLEIDADTPEAARQAATELTPTDLARQGHADILSFKIAAREVTPAAALGGAHDEPEAENAPHKPRPSGWYRPR